MGTEWPIFALLHSYDWSYPGIPRNNDYDARSGEEECEDEGH